MNKNAIWGIIGLMSVALLGIIVMQAYWINQSIKINEEQFDKNIFSALNSVAAKLEFAEIYAAYNSSKPAVSSQISIQNQIPGDVHYNEKISIEYSYRQNVVADSFLILNEEGDYESHDENNCGCSRCKSRRMESIRDAYFDQYVVAYTKQAVCTKPIRERIDFEFFDELLSNGLKNHGIKTSYDYGIYSERKNTFILTNSGTSNKSSENKATIAKATAFNLLNSSYKIRLFPSEMNTPGYLMVYFPNKTGYMWRTVLPTLIGAVLFSGIILFCFAYTIQVIFEQKKLSEIKNDFINNMTHEFKTPIATISLASDAITSPMILGSPEKLKRFAGIIKTENKRMNNQVEKVLQMALLDKKEFKLNIKEVDTHEIIENAVATINLQVEGKGGSVTTDLKATNPILKADETHITNAILNLLDNANKYSPDQPEIKVMTRNTPTGVQITVADKGLGMSKDTRKRIFDKFYRVHTGNLHDIKGFGLGLNYVKAILDAHHGNINVKSDLGKGSRFTLFFPFDPEQA